jgi:hypothetical protein
VNGRPQPLLARAGITGVVASLLAVALAFGLIDDSQAQALAASFAGIIGLVAPVLTALLARGKVTPISDPKTEVDGVLVPLVPQNGPVPPSARRMI